MIIIENGKIKRVMILFCLCLLLLPAGWLSASGVSILKHNDQTELLISTTDDGSDFPGIELELAGEGIIILKNSKETNELRFSTGGKAEKVYIYQSLGRLNPEKIIITGENNDFDLISACIMPDVKERLSLPADIGHIIFSNFNINALNDWMVYSWNLVPEIIIFDTLDYKAQSRLFKRLAFFVEKPGYTGRLVTNEELKDKHGWNAHDYKPDDLADFFNEAEKKAFALNQEEIYLRQLLITQGIITEAIESAGSLPYQAGTGAVLSVSRETEANWRYRFLTHECLHGIFFTDSKFKSDVFDVYAELSADEVEFWKHLLDYRRYDIQNDYLLVNEFMAYSLQQPINEVDEYFKGFLYKRMTTARPYETDFVASFDRNYPKSFRSAVLKLEKVLHDHTGRMAGHLANLYPADVKDSFFNLFPPI